QLHCRWWTDFVRTGNPRQLPPRSRLCRSYLKGREAGRPSCTEPDEIRNGAQREDCQGARTRHTHVHSSARRRGDRMSLGMQRRRFVSLLGGAATWPLAVRAQVAGKVWRVGYLDPAVERTDTTLGLAAMREHLAKLGWTEGRNLQIDIRFGLGD